MSSAADELKARVCTRVIALLTPKDSSAFQKTLLNQPPAIEQTLVKQQTVPLVLSVVLLLVGCMLGVAFHKLTHADVSAALSSDEDDTDSEVDEPSS